MTTSETAVDRIKKGKGRVVNARFAVMCGHYLFDADFCAPQEVPLGCNAASGWEKGIVEMASAIRRPWMTIDDSPA